MKHFIGPFWYTLYRDLQMFNYFRWFWCVTLLYFILHLIVLKPPLFARMEEMRAAF